MGDLGWQGGEGMDRPKHILTGFLEQVPEQRFSVCSALGRLWETCPKTRRKQAAGSTWQPCFFCCQACRSAWCCQCTTLMLILFAHCGRPSLQCLGFCELGMPSALLYRVVCQGTGFLWGPECHTAKHKGHI